MERVREIEKQSKRERERKYASRKKKKDLKTMQKYI